MNPQTIQLDVLFPGLICLLTLPHAESLATCTWGTWKGDGHEGFPRSATTASSDCPKKQVSNFFFFVMRRM